MSNRGKRTKCMHAHIQLYLRTRRSGNLCDIVKFSHVLISAIVRTHFTILRLVSGLMDRSVASLNPSHVRYQHMSCQFLPASLSWKPVLSFCRALICWMPFVPEHMVYVRAYAVYPLPIHTYARRVLSFYYHPPTPPSNPGANHRLNMPQLMCLCVNLFTCARALLY